MNNCLIYQKDGLWHVEDHNRTPVAGSPASTEAEAQRIAENHASCMAFARYSRETTKRELGYHYDPTD